VSGFGVAPKRTSLLRLHLFFTPFTLEPVVRKVREPETASPTRETHALPAEIPSKRDVATANESIIEIESACFHARPIFWSVIRHDTEFSYYRH
jgi:hypothetical protein